MTTKQRSTNTGNLVVLGAGESGVGAAILAKKQGFSVLVSDMGQIAPAYKATLLDYQIEFEEGKHSEAHILAWANAVIKSPGIPNTAPLVTALAEKGLEVMDELEFASRYTTAKIIAITGSNGKTTTTRLIHHMLKEAGLDVGLAGNIGFSFAKQVAEQDSAYYVLEVSSFQLDNMTTFTPDIALLLNITPDHLDRYNYELDLYIASKLRLFQNKKAHQVFIYNGDDQNIAKGLATHHPDLAPAKGLAIPMQDIQVAQSDLHFPHLGWILPKEQLSLQGRHNWFNIRCAALAAEAIGVQEAVIQTALGNFETEPHRLEPVVTIHEVDYINDSKATNVDATYYALEAMQQPIIWIVGGTDKGNDYSPLMRLVQEKVRAIVCMGKDNRKLFEAFSPVHEIIVECRSVQEALKLSSLYAEPGDVVLLSPACASFDLFKNYQDRGNQFKDLLMQQYKMLTEGIQVELKIDLSSNIADDHQSDR